MMSQALLNFLPPIVSILALIFLTVRLRLFSSSEHEGRLQIIFGGSLAVLASSWQIVRTFAEYENWFVVDAYPAIDLVQVIVLIAGLLLMAVGLILHVDYWQSLRESLGERENRLSILDNLQQDARQPYQLVELLTISLREILSHLPGCSGVVFLVNRGRREFILTSMSGLSKTETASLERYEYGGNLPTQAVELGHPLVGGSFSFTGSEISTDEPRFFSSLALPLISGMDKMGVILLLSDIGNAFTRTDISSLAPAAEWLAEKVKSARATRELAVTKKKISEILENHQSLTDRLSNCARQLTTASDMVALCRRLIGLLGAESALLVKMQSGVLGVVASSDPGENLSENFRAALIDALGRRKPIIINQELADDENDRQVFESTLVYPLPGFIVPAALLLKQTDRPFDISEADLASLEPFALLVQIGLQTSDNYRLSLTRRAGIDRILELLTQEVNPVDRQGWPIQFAVLLEKSGFPKNTLVLPFSDNLSPLLQSTLSAASIKTDLSSLRLRPGEGSVGLASETGTVQVRQGTKVVSDDMQKYSDQNRDIMLTLFEEIGSPTFLAACPLHSLRSVAGTILVVSSGIDPFEGAEWERFLILATGLYSMRLALTSIKSDKQHENISSMNPAGLASLSNEINNVLTGIVGKTELVASSADLPAQLRSNVREVLEEAERAAAILRVGLMRGGSDQPAKELKNESINTDASQPGEDLSELLGRHQISGNLYMIDGKPREINLVVESNDRSTIPKQEMKGFFESIVSQLANGSPDEALLTITVYSDHGMLFVDLCRHRKHFPPTSRLASSATYKPITAIQADRPDDSFFKRLSGYAVEGVVDPSTSDPSYYSLRFPKQEPSLTVEKNDSTEAAIRLLAIDDQPVILELIEAMGQSQGFAVDTATDGEKGLRLAALNSYDIILTDLAMPGLSGLEVARRLRRMNFSSPVVLITGWEATLSPANLEASGITEVLYKPFRIEQLSNIILSAVSQPK